MTGRWDRKPRSLLERDRALGRIGDALAAAGRGEGVLLPIEGPAGCGKSALLRAAAADAERAGFAVLTATGRELERGFAFGAVAQLFSPLLESLEEDQRAELFSGAATLARPLFEQAVAAGDVFPLLHGLHSLCANLAAQGPVLVIVDDAHWADDPSLVFLAYLAPRVAELGLCLAVGVRSGESEAGAQLIGALAREGARSVEPEPLSDAAVAQLLRARLDVPGRERLAPECARATAGNPLFLRELIRSLDAAGIDDPDLVASAARDSVGRIVLDRIDGLAEQEASVVRAIAVLGEDPDPTLITMLSGVDPKRVAEAIDRLAQLGLLDPATPLGFEHPIVRQAVYESIAPAARSRDHLRVGQALAGDPAACERAATHLLATDIAVEPAGPEAVEALRLAASRARERGASELGARFLARALEERLDPALRRALLVELGTSELRLGKAGAVSRLAEAEELSASGPERAETALALSTAQAQTGDLDAAVATCEGALAAVGTNRELRLALEAQRANASWLAGTLSEAERERLRALEAEVGGAATPAERAVLTILAIEAGVTATRGATKVNELAERALAQGELLADVGAEHPFYVAAGAAKVLSGNYGEAIVEWTRGVESSRRRGSLYGYATALFSRAYSKHLAGDLQGAEADSAEAFELLPESELITAPLSLATAANVAAERGGLQKRIEKVLEALVAGREPLAIGTGDYAVLASGWLALSRGEVEHALERFTETGRHAKLIGWVGPPSMPWRSGAALALSRLGRGEEALELAEEELDLSRAFESPAPIGIALRSKAIVLGGEPGIELLRESVATLSGSEGALEHAKSLIELGAALLGSGAEREACDVLREGMDRAHHCGSNFAVDRALAELNAAGARPRRPALRGAQALSPKELQTTRLAAEGLGNREIAEAMFLTRRTVEMHLTSAYRKLGISSREELSEALSTT